MLDNDIIEPIASIKWALALQEFSVTFKYRAGRANVAADCLSRLKSNAKLKSNLI